MRASVSIAFILSAGILPAQAPAPPPPSAPPPPQFMTMKGLRLGCFDKPFLEAEGMDLFICNGVKGVSGGRMKSDKRQTIYVHDPEIAQNLNYQAARVECGSAKVVVSMAGDSPVFTCPAKELRDTERFQVASRSQWAKFQTALTK